MLIIKVYATKRADDITEPKMILDLIEEIQIRNVGRRDEETWEYEVEKPENISGKIIHFRNQGYRPLLRKVLGLLIGHKPGGTNGGE